MSDLTDPGSLAAGEVLDIGRSLIRLDNDVEFLKELLSFFLVDGPARLSRMEQGLAADDLAGAGTAAHSLKGMCGTLNAPALMEMSLRMEAACLKGDAQAAQALLPLLRRHLEAVLERIGEFLETS